MTKELFYLILAKSLIDESIDDLKIFKRHTKALSSIEKDLKDIYLHMVDNYRRYKVKNKHIDTVASIYNTIISEDKIDIDINIIVYALSWYKSFLINTPKLDNKLYLLKVERVIKEITSTMSDMSTSDKNNSASSPASKALLLKTTFNQQLNKYFEEENNEAISTSNSGS